MPRQHHLAEDPQSTRFLCGGRRLGVRRSTNRRRRLTRSGRRSRGGLRCSCLPGGPARGRRTRRTSGARWHRLDNRLHFADVGLRTGALLGVPETAAWTSRQAERPVVGQGLS